MKIAFFNYLMLEYGGGTAQYFIDVSAGLKKRYPELEIAIVTLDKKWVEKIQSLYSFYFGRNVSQELVTHRQYLNLSEKLQPVAYYKFDNLNKLKNKLCEFDVIYSKNDMLEASILRFVVGYERLKQVVFGFHTPVLFEITNSLQSRLHNILYNSFFYSYLLKRAQKFQVINSFDEHLLKKKFPDKKIYKIFNPYDFDGFAKIAEKRIYPFNWDLKKYNILWVGRLTKEKGAEELVRLIEQVNSLNYEKKIIWNIIGSGEEEQEVIKLKEKWNNINYFGYIEHDYLASIYVRNDLFITMSKWETFPYTLLEAQSSGLPAISYRIHGCDEIITHKENGYLVSSSDEFREKLLYLITHKVFKKKGISSYIRKKFNQEHIYQELYKMFTT